MIAKPTQRTLLEIYKTVLREEEFIVTLFENRLSFFTGLMSTIITAIVLGVFSAKTLVESFALLFGPIILVFVSISGINAARRAFIRIYKILTIRAKLEQALGLTKPQKYRSTDKDIYWDSEPFIDLEYISDRKRYKNSVEHFENSIKRKDNLLSQTTRFYTFFIIIGVATEILIIVRVISLI